MLITPLIVAAHIGALASQQCQAAATAPALDHAIVVVNNLDAGADAFRTLGFRIKAGRPHANGLLNRHIKFRDGTEVELMTVRGAPRDEMARDYARLMRAGDGGVYLALSVPDLNRVERHAMQLNARARASSSGPWRFVSFPDSSELAAVFFTSGGGTIVDADSIFRHQPPVDRFAEAWVEGGSELTDLLRRLGAADCGTARGPDGRAGQRLALRRGNIVVVERQGAQRPRVLGVVLDTPASTQAIVRPIATFWIQYQ
jgi:hypothetical protein